VIISKTVSKEDNDSIFYISRVTFCCRHMSRLFFRRYVRYDECTDQLLISFSKDDDSYIPISYCPICGDPVHIDTVPMS
jgi:hypothetical protein